MGADGACRKDVLAALAHHGVAIADLGNGDYELSKGTALCCQHFRDTISRSVLDYLMRQFGGPPMAAFYPPPGGRVH